MTNPTSVPQIVWDDLGIDHTDLGCVMIDVIPHPDILDIAGRMEDDAYYANDSTYGYIDGISKQHHATLLYGLTVDPNDHVKAVEALVLDNSDFRKIVKDGVIVKEFGFFPSSVPSHPDYGCVVAHLVPDQLAYLNERLRLMPHIDTWPDYRAHVTIGYVNVRTAAYWVDKLNGAIRTIGAARSMEFDKLNLGSFKPWLHGNEDQ
jgi:2'-5' RNA ligase